METADLLADVFAALARLGGSSAGLLAHDVARIKDATTRLSGAVSDLATLHMAHAGPLELERAEGDVTVARGRWLEAMASAEKHATEAGLSLLQAAPGLLYHVAVTLIERRT